MLLLWSLLDWSGGGFLIQALSLFLSFTHTCVCGCVRVGGCVTQVVISIGNIVERESGCVDEGVCVEVVFLIMDNTQLENIGLGKAGRK